MPTLLLLLVVCAVVCVAVLPAASATTRAALLVAVRGAVDASGRRCGPSAVTTALTWAIQMQEQRKMVMGMAGGAAMITAVAAAFDSGVEPWTGARLVVGRGSSNRLLHRPSETAPWPAQVGVCAGVCASVCVGVCVDLVDRQEGDERGMRVEERENPPML